MEIKTLCSSSGQQNATAHKIHSFKFLCFKKSLCSLLVINDCDRMGDARRQTSIKAGSSKCFSGGGALPSMNLTNFTFDIFYQDVFRQNGLGFILLHWCFVLFLVQGSKATAAVDVLQSY